MVHAYDSGCMRSHSHHDTRGEEEGGGWGREGTGDCRLTCRFQYKGALTPPIETLSTKHWLHQLINIYTHTHNFHCTQHTFTHSHTHLYTTVEPLHLPFKLIYWRGFVVFKRDSLSQKELHHWDVGVSAVCLFVGVGGGTLTKENNNNNYNNI